MDLREIQEVKINQTCVFWNIGGKGERDIMNSLVFWMYNGDAYGYQDRGNGEEDGFGHARIKMPLRYTRNTQEIDVSQCQSFVCVKHLQLRVDTNF